MSLTDGYCTPEWLCARLPIVDLDPCSNPRSHVRSRYAYRLESGDDGLTAPWLSSIFMNHPYSRPLPWMMKLRAEEAAGRTRDAIVLAKLDCSTVWWPVLVDPSSRDVDLWLLCKRVAFDIPPDLLAEMQRKWEAKGNTGPCPTSNNFCSAIVHRRMPGREALDLHDIAELWRCP